jgi:3-methyladenine DNA glycosylase/8-oxoguanine DNA glycosylase
VKVLLPTPPDFDFLECINSHGWKSLKPFHCDAEKSVLTRIEGLADGHVVLLTISSANGALEVQSTIEAPADELEIRVRRMLQLDIPMFGFHEYCAGKENLLHVPHLRQGRLLRSPTLFEDIVKVIATTNTTWTQTKAMVSRIVDSFGSPLPEDESFHAFPTPEQIATVPFEEFADKARMGYRNAAIHKIATAVAEGSLDVESLQSEPLTSAELYKKLLALPGVGPYAASCLLIYLGHYDRVNVDSSARAAVGKEVGTPVTDKEAHAFFEEYGEWKALVYHFYRWRE